MKKIICATLIFFISKILMASGIKKDELLTFYPTYAYLDNQNIYATIHAHVYEPEENSPVRKLLVKSLSAIFKNNNKSSIFEKRIKFFLFDNERYKHIKINFNNSVLTLKRTSANGHSLTPIKLKAGKYLKLLKKSSRLDYAAILPENDKRTFKGKIQFISPKGISVISDIDDTIKISNALNKQELLKNIFIRKFKSVQGLSNIYQRWKKKGAVFHYVSGSPWQLYQPISDFIKDENFPAGSMHLKYFRLKDRSSVKFLIADQLSYKIKIIEKIFSDFPGRKFILVGDSGEKDPEIYAKIAEKYPDQVKAVCIRNLNNSTAERYKNLFSHLKNIRVIIFKDSSELKDIL